MSNVAHGAFALTPSESNFERLTKRLLALRAEIDGRVWRRDVSAGEVGQDPVGLFGGKHPGMLGRVALELPGHPFFLATLFHPQAGTLAGAPLSPLIEAFADAALDRAQVAA